MLDLSATYKNFGILQFFSSKQQKRSLCLDFGRSDAFLDPSQRWGELSGWTNFDDGTLGTQKN